eukprot:m.384456 g.384456  ORF g.384456 m.384456 type:complete len:646 (-) comp20048_c0_seq32:38-1975(-)
MAGSSQGDGGCMSPVAETARALRLPLNHVKAAVAMFKDDQTVPFVARYRREQVGWLSAADLRQVKASHEAFEAVAAKAASVMSKLTSADKLSRHLERALRSATSLAEIDDLYAPFKTKVKSKASTARALGLEPLAQDILDGKRVNLAQASITKRLPREQLDAGVQHILAEHTARDPVCRSIARQKFERATLTCKLRPSADRQQAAHYANYANFNMPVSRVQPHQTLAIARAEKAKVVVASIVLSPHQQQEVLQRLNRNQLNSIHKDHQALVKASVEDAFARLMRPQQQRQLRKELAARAQAQGLHIFSNNVSSLLLAQPVRQRILSIDPGFRNGCKVVALSEEGDVLGSAVVFPFTGRGQDAARRTVLQLLRDHACTLVAVGNGTACRETEQFVVRLRDDIPDLVYTVVPEAGASVWSVSADAEQEFPAMDCTLRSAVSIGRRLQDPLAELVKIDPKHLGVGMYQLDLADKQLAMSLDAVVEDCVAYVGVDLNTCSKALLQRVPGLSAKKAAAIFAHAKTQGFKTRAEVAKVKGIGRKTYQQCVGFLRVTRASTDDPWLRLESTRIHPDDYDLTKFLLKTLGASHNTLCTPAMQPKASSRRHEITKSRRRRDITNSTAGQPTSSSTISVTLDQIAPWQATCCRTK